MRSKATQAAHLKACTAGARARMDAAERRFEDALTALIEASVSYARAGTREYAFHHPRRCVIWCAAMGGQGLDVERHTHDDHKPNDYDFEGDPVKRLNGRDIAQPEFVVRLQEIRDKQRFPFALGGDLRLEFRGGVVHSDLTHWGAIKDDPYPGYKKFVR